MKKTSHTSMDGFVPRRPNTTGRRAHMGKPTTASPRQELGRSTPGRQLQPVRVESARNDISMSLRSIDDEVEPKASRRRLIGHKRESKTNKLPTRRRKNIKLFFRSILIIGFIIGAFFAWKVLNNSGKIFNGNFLGVFHHQKLKEDKNGRTNILIFGTSGWSMAGDDWDGAMLTDSIMVVSVDQDGTEAYTMSLPRDMYVGTCTSTGKINEVYWCAQQSGKSDAESAMEFADTVGEILGLDVQYYVHANWNAMVQGVDAVGGVDVKIEGTTGEGIYDVATNIRYKEGEIAHLDGQKALAFARARGSAGGYGLDGSNFARERNQQRLLSALQKKATSGTTLANPLAVTGMMDAMGDNLRTNFQTNELQALINIAKDNTKTTPLPFVDRPNDEPDLMDSTGNPVAGQGIYTDIQAYIKKSIMGDKSANVDVLNGSGVAGMAKEKADELGELGFIISTVDNAPKDVSGEVTIYQLDESKKSAASQLKEHYGTSIKTGTPEGYTPSDGADFVLIFGAM